jgi:hypothetical protein
MDFYASNQLRENHPGWSLLRAQNAPLATSFFIKAFTAPNQRDIGRQEIVDHLDDVLLGLRDVYGEDKFSGSGIGHYEAELGMNVLAVSPRSMRQA